MSELQAKFQAEAAEFKALQKELQKVCAVLMVSFQRSHSPQAIAASQRLQSQCSENEVHVTLPHFFIRILIPPPFPSVPFVRHFQLVAREFSLLPDDAEVGAHQTLALLTVHQRVAPTRCSDHFQVFKLVGPALMRQELAEVCSFVVEIQNAADNFVAGIE